MAEGGYEERRNEYRNEYDNLDLETLDDMYGELEEVQVDNSRYSESRRRMEYIDSIRREEETSFTDSLSRDGAVITGDLRTIEKEMFLSKHLGVDVRYGDGPASDKLILETIICIINDRGITVGVEFDGVKVVVRETGGGFKYSDNKSNTRIVRTVNIYKELVEKAKEEHAKNGRTY